MQKVAAYLLERRDGVVDVAARRGEAEKVLAEIQKWLSEKGALPGASSGSYQSEDGSHASFGGDHAVDGDRSWSMVHLDELASDGRKFSASVSVTTTSEGVAVYASMEAGSAVSLVGPVEVDPRCPKIVRTLIESGGRWHHGASQLHPLRRVVGFDQGEALAGEIAAPSRTVPVVVVTVDEFGQALSRLDDRLAYDLAGLCNVVAVDADGTWALTDTFGKSLSCYSGAVRLYWPRFSRASDPYAHPLWTAARLRTSGEDPNATRERFRRQLRGLVMRASALSVVRPREIDEIRTAASRQTFLEMKAKAASLEDFAGLADTYATDNDKLRGENADLRETIAELQSRVTELEVMPQGVGAKSEIAPETGTEAQDDSAPPAKDEVRYYKKKYAAKTHDVFVRVADCGCNTWQGASKADKAKKGIARLENGRTNWKTVQHCGSCLGGGMWKVRW